MYKKSLYLGAAALALLMVLALAGCSNPASDDGGAAPQAGGSAVIPDGAVYTADFFELQGLLNDYSADTNQVSHIVYTEDVAIADFPSPLTIPAGKTVYLNNASNNGVAFSAVEVNIIVEEGARLVLLADFTTDGADKRLLVKGLADIYAGLTVDNALDVADYFIDANGTVTARGTVIGTGRVVIHSGGTLNLVADDIAPQPSTDRFTPAQAWAAAGQGSLAITGPLPANYSVVDVLAGVSPGGGRTYTVVTNGGGVLPQVIPAGAFITANGVITDAEGHTLRVHGSLTATHAASTFADVVTLTVNGELIANAATFENVETLTVSSLDTDNLTSRASTGSAAVWNRSYLGADKATLKKAKSVIIGDRGEFASESTAIDLPAGARISLGRSASFTASGTTNNSFDKLESLFVGPASSVAIASTAVTLKSLKTLTLQDSASFAVNTAGNSVTYLVEDTPPTPPNKTQINLGLNTLYLVGTAPSAKVAVTIASDSSLRATSVLAIYAGSTFTVDAGKTLTVPTGAVVDFSAVTTGATAVPTAPDLAPIQINGTIETTGTGSIVGPATVAGLPAGADLNKFIAFGAGGKVLLNWGTSFLYGTAAFVGTASSPFQWKTTPTDGAQIELNAAGLTIRDTDGGGAAVTVGAPATVLKDQTLTLDTGAQLLVTVAANTLEFAGDAGTTGGALLKGPGAVVVAANTEIVGGSSGWQAVGPDTIKLSVATAKATIEKTASGTTTFRALGPSAVITQNAASGNGLVIAANTTIELGGTAVVPGGSIVLKADVSPATDHGTLELTFHASTPAKITLGEGAGTVETTTLGTSPVPTIGGKGITTTLLAANLNVTSATAADRKLNSLTGPSATPNGTIKPAAVSTATVNNDVVIVSNAIFVPAP